MNGMHKYPAKLHILLVCKTWKYEMEQRLFGRSQFVFSSGPHLRRFLLAEPNHEREKYPYSKAEETIPSTFMLLPTRLWITRVELFLTPLRDELIFEIRKAVWRWKDSDYQAIDEAARIEMMHGVRIVLRIIPECY